MIGIVGEKIGGDGDLARGAPTRRPPHHFYGLFSCHRTNGGHGPGHGDAIDIEDQARFEEVCQAPGLALDERRVRQLGRRIYSQLVRDIEIVQHQPALEALTCQVRIEVTERSRVREKLRRQENRPGKSERAQQSQG